MKERKRADYIDVDNTPEEAAWSATKAGLTASRQQEAAARFETVSGKETAADSCARLELAVQENTMRQQRGDKDRRAVNACELQRNAAILERRVAEEKETDDTAVCGTQDATREKSALVRNCRLPTPWTADRATELCQFCSASSPLTDHEPVYCFAQSGSTAQVFESSTLGDDPLHPLPCSARKRMGPICSFVHRAPVRRKIGQAANENERVELLLRKVGTWQICSAV